MNDTIDNVPFGGETEFDHVNIMQIDPAFENLPVGYYTLQINKLTPKVIECKNGKNAGKSLRVLKGSYTVVKHDTFSGRKVWHDFFTNNPVDMKELRRQADAIGVPQAPDQSIVDYAVQVSGLTPPPEFQIFIGEEPDYRSGAPVNVLKFNQAKPA